MPKWPVPVFCRFWFQGELKNKYFRNCKRKLFYEVLHRKTPEARRGATGGPQGAHTLPRRAPTSGHAWHRCGPPGPPCPEVRSRRHRRGEIYSSSRHPAGGEIITGGLL